MCQPIQHKTCEAAPESRGQRYCGCDCKPGFVLRKKGQVHAYLLKLGADPNTTDEKGDTPLMHVINDVPDKKFKQKQYLAKIRVLLQHGANAYDPVVRACLHTQDSIITVELLRKILSTVSEEVDLKTLSIKGKTPLHVAADWDWPLAARELTKLVPLNRTDDQGHTPLLVAAEHDKLEVAEVLIKAGANLEHADGEGNTPLVVTTASK